MMELLGGLIIFALVVVPLWRIFGRTGRSGAWALLMVIPVVGSSVVALLWGYGPWPRHEGPYQQGTSGQGTSGQAGPTAGPPPSA